MTITPPRSPGELFISLVCASGFIGLVGLTAYLTAPNQQQERIGLVAGVVGIGFALVVLIVAGAAKLYNNRH